MARERRLKHALPEPLQSWARERMAQRGFTSIDEYIRHLVREDNTRHERAALEARLLHAMNSGPPIRATKKFWADRRARLEQLIVTKSNGKRR